MCRMVEYVHHVDEETFLMNEAARVSRILKNLIPKRKRRFFEERRLSCATGEYGNGPQGYVGSIHTLDKDEKGIINVSYNTSKKGKIFIRSAVLSLDDIKRVLDSKEC